MKVFTHIQEAFINLFSSKLRSILALLGILVGTASVVAMVLGGQLATNEAIKQFKTLGTDLLAISLSESQKDSTTNASNPEASMSLNDASTIYQADNHIIDATPYTQLYNSIIFNGHELSGSVLGVTNSFARVVHVDLQKGRFISLFDGYGFFCVIGQGIYEAMKAFTYSDPIGQQIQIGKDIFQIVGVAKPWPENTFVYANIDNTVMIPLLASTALSKYATINNIIIRLAPETDIEVVKKNITRYIDQRIGSKQLFFRSAKELISHMTKQSEILTIFLGLIGSISLIVGGIGVMNIMLVSVVERKREIGIRLAVGAQREDIWFLFLVEAIMLSLVGGGLGVLIGIFVAYVIAWISHWQFLLFLLPPLIGFTVSVAIGIFFGFYPAYKASQIDPINALRSD